MPQRYARHYRASRSSGPVSGFLATSPVGQSRAMARPLAGRVSLARSIAGMPRGSLTRSVFEDERDCQSAAPRTGADGRAPRGPGRVAPGIAPPGLPQIRKCKAQNSSCHTSSTALRSPYNRDFSTSSVGRVVPRAPAGRVNKEGHHASTSDRRRPPPRRIRLTRYPFPSQLSPAL